MKMMQQMVTFQPSEKLALGVHTKVLHAMTQFIHHKTPHGCGKGNWNTNPARNAYPDREGGRNKSGQRIRNRPKEHTKIIGVLMVIEMYSLPQGRSPWGSVQETCMQKKAMHAIFDKGVSHQRRKNTSDDSKWGNREIGKQSHRNDKTTDPQHPIHLNRGIQNVRAHQITKVHPIKLIFLSIPWFR
jgi:hypothetical protein